MSTVTLKSSGPGGSPCNVKVRVRVRVRVRVGVRAVVRDRLGSG